MKIEFSIQVYNNFRSGRAALPPPIVQNSFFNFYEKALQTNLTAPSFLTLVLTNLFVPYAIWAWLYAFVTLQHHTHPNVPWFDKRTEWNFFNAQVRASVHVVLPRIIEILFLNVL